MSFPPARALREQFLQRSFTCPGTTRKRCGASCPRIILRTPPGRWERRRTRLPERISYAIGRVGTSRGRSCVSTSSPIRFRRNPRTSVPTARTREAPPPTTGSKTMPHAIAPFFSIKKPSGTENPRRQPTTSASIACFRATAPLDAQPHFHILEIPFSRSVRCLMSSRKRFFDQGKTMHGTGTCMTPGTRKARRL